LDRRELDVLSPNLGLHELVIRGNSLEPPLVEILADTPHLLPQVLVCAQSIARIDPQISALQTALQGDGLSQVRPTDGRT